MQNMSIEDKRMWMKLFKKHFYSRLALVLRYECASSTRLLAFWISSLTSFKVFLGFSFDCGSTQVNKTKFRFYGVILDFQICLFDFQNWVWIEFEIDIYGGAMLRAVYPFYNIPTQKKPLVHSITAAAHKDSVFFFSACTANFSKVAMLPHVWF